MDSHEAREILSLYRPGDTNSMDRRMAEALELARHDPQLAIWFGQHCAAHVQLPAISEAPAVPAPKAERPEDTADDDHIIPLTKPALLMIGAAVLAVVAVLLWSLLMQAPRDNFASYRDRMARLVQRSFPMKIVLTDQSAIRQYFRTNGGPYDFSLPHNLEKFPGTGAAVLTWHSQPVSLFGLDAGANTNLYFFLIKKTTFANEPIPAKPQFSRVGRVMTASWMAGNNVYLVTGPNDEAALQSFLSASP